MEYETRDAGRETGAGTDYARYERVWQRVAPTLEAYPAAAESAMPVQPAQNAGALPDNTPLSANTVQQELTLPGAQANPCCMGTEAQELVDVLEGFAQEELTDGAGYRQLARSAPNRVAAAVLRELGCGAERRGRELAAACFVITGTRRVGASAAVVLPRLPYCELLRDRYHAAACNALNYARAEDATPDPCLQRLLHRFGEEAYEASDRLLRLLGQCR